jgi:hypothetical protein
MKIKNIAMFVLTALLGIGLAAKFGSKSKYHQIEERLDSLRILNKKITTFDSIQSASQNRFLDSLSTIKTKLDYERVQRIKENKLLRKRNQDLQDRFNSITVPDRPEFFQLLQPAGTGTVLN